MKSDFVTFFAPGGYEQTRFNSSQENGTVRWRYANGDSSRQKGNFGEFLKSTGGIDIKINLSQRTNVQVTISPNPSYRQPSRILRLSAGEDPEWVDISKNNLDLGRGDHLLVPVDQESEGVLADLCKKLKYLPADYETIIMNAIRRPSLEWRMSRLERAAGFDRVGDLSAGKQVIVAADINEGRALREKWNKFWPWLVVFLIGGLCGWFGTYVAQQLWGTEKAPAQLMATTTTLQSSPASSSPTGTLVTFTAKVVAQSKPGHDKPGGMVNFSIDNQVREEAVNGGVAVHRTAALQEGSHNITAEYSGDSKFASSSSDTLSYTVVLPDNTGSGSVQKDTTVELQSDPNPSAPGQSVTLTATVRSSSGIPSGTVSFLVGKNLLGSAPLTSGVAVFKRSFMKGTLKIVAKYGGTSTFKKSKSSPLTQTIKAAGKDGSTGTLTTGGQQTGDQQPGSQNSFQSIEEAVNAAKNSSTDAAGSASKADAAATQAKTDTDAAKKLGKNDAGSASLMQEVKNNFGEADKAAKDARDAAAKAKKAADDASTAKSLETAAKHARTASDAATLAKIRADAAIAAASAVAAAKKKLEESAK